MIQFHQCICLKWIAYIPPVVSGCCLFETAMLSFRSSEPRTDIDGIITDASLLGTNISPTSRYFWVDEFPFLHVSSLTLDIKWIRTWWQDCHLSKYLQLLFKTTHTSIIRFTIFSNEQLRLWLQKLPLDPRESEPVATKKCFAPQWSLGFYDGLYRLFIICIFLGGSLHHRSASADIEAMNSAEWFFCSWKAALWMPLFEVVHLKYVLY